MSLWADHLKAQPAVVEGSALDKANSRLESLSADARKAAWEHDCLLLARDTASIAKVFNACEKTERSERLKKITHMRAENTIGSNIVENFTSKHACHKSGTEADLLTFVDQVALGPKLNSRVALLPLVGGLNCCLHVNLLENSMPV